ncbi:MAG: thioredoxin family protein [Arcobacteraceae bacterium]
MFKFLISIICFSNLLLAQSLLTYTNYDEAIHQAKKQNKHVLMFVYTDYCSWCDKMKKTTLSHQKTIEFINKNYIFLSINKEKENFPKAFTPRYIPTTYLIDAQNQEEIYALFGYKTSSELIEELSNDAL